MGHSPYFVFLMPSALNASLIWFVSWHFFGSSLKEKFFSFENTEKQSTQLFFDREKNEEGDITSKIDSPLLNNNASFDDWPEIYFFLTKLKKAFIGFYNDESTRNF